MSRARYIIDLWYLCVYDPWCFLGVLEEGLAFLRVALPQWSAEPVGSLLPYSYSILELGVVMKYIQRFYVDHRRCSLPDPLLPLWDG